MTMVTPPPPPRYRLRLLLPLIMRFKHALAYFHGQCTQHKRTDKVASRENLILAGTIMMQNLPPSNRELFIRNTDAIFIHQRIFVIFINRS